MGLSLCKAMLVEPLLIPMSSTEPTRLSGSQPRSQAVSAVIALITVI